MSADSIAIPSNRRRFVTWAAGSAAAVFFSGRTAKGQSASGRSGSRALVCVHLVGGSDGWDAAVPQSVADSAAWKSARPSLSAVPRIVASGLSGEALSFHPALAPLSSLYDMGRLALFAGVGSLAPGAAGRPPAGAMTHADLRAMALPGGFLLPDWVGDASGALYDFPSALQPGRSSPVAVSQKRVISRSMDAAERRSTAASLLRAGASSVSNGAAFPATSLGRQLQQIFTLIASGRTSDAVYSATLGRFDTHAGQAQVNAAIWRELAEAAAAFHSAVESAGLSSRVTLYTDSEFGRTLVENAQGGTDHGWSSLQFALGGPVAGGRVYGSFPSLARGGPDDLTGHGVFAPSVSRDAYFATLASWHGMGFGEVLQKFPGVTSAAALLPVLS
ncbi:MAG: DUF1501 domain-containing protein [Bryobacteraceae bacterium]|nr:DUF1501 domain-containing protein [Bryobacteraceae bacterium]